MACTDLGAIIDKFESFTQKPANYLTVQSGIRENVKNLVKSVYDYTKAEEKSEKKTKKSALSELIVQDFDEEQIWQQIELQNSECWDQLVWEVANCMSSKQDLTFPVEVGSASNSNEDDEKDSLASDEEDMEDSESEEVSKKGKEAKKIKEKKSKHASVAQLDSKSESESHRNTRESNPKNKGNKKHATSIVDDEFFKLSEMEKFLVNEERKEGKKVAKDSDEESVDMFEEDDGEESDENNMMYTDFFDGQENNEEQGEQYRDEDGEDDELSEKDQGDDEDLNDSDASANIDDAEMEVDTPSSKNTKKKDKKVTFADGSSDDESDDSSDMEQTVANGKDNKYEKKSEFELRQQRLQQQISRLEDKTLSDAPWQLKGEVDATKRPQNSLLQEVVDFDLTTRPAPIITEQTTVTLEDIIRRRVKDKAWDDVVRKEKPIDDQLAFRKTEIIDQSKSKLSLAQVYEAEYLKQKQALSGDVEEEKEPESHTQIKDAMSKLFSKLDALSHYHYTPKAPQAEVKIVSNTPAISMEEVAPVATSDAALLAPEEVKKKHRGDLISKEERSQTDKNRERRKKKKLQKKKGPVTKVTDNRNTKKGVEASDKSLKTSKAFFQQLNDDSSSIIKNKRNVKNKGQ